ncbi:transmembrane protein, putative [Medicago truncatula]|uniref:Transmembrane protein, putative n=1 Tax=Medicago truncatula TaxID=3880 RepID=G7KXU6_MEDTR|nr:transmembrane protein, putative [Medicago truncatula]
MREKAIYRSMKSENSLQRFALMHHRMTTTCGELARFWLAAGMLKAWSPGTLCNYLALVSSARCGELNFAFLMVSLVLACIFLIRTQDIKQREENREKYKKAEKGDHSPPTRHGKQQRRAIPECNKDHTPPTRNGE